LAGVFVEKSVGQRADDAQRAVHVLLFLPAFSFPVLPILEEAFNAG